MRARVIAQGVTMAFLAYGTFLATSDNQEREEKIKSGRLRYKLRGGED